MFSDIKGYSSMMGRDEDHALKLLDIHNKILESRIESLNGTIVKFMGDAVLASFNSAVDAADCALSIQTEFSRLNKHRGKKDQIWIRIGLHLGDVLHKHEDVFGDGVNVASRLEPLSEPGGIVVSSTVKDIIQANSRFHLEPMGELQLKNIAYKVWAYRMLTPSSGNAYIRSMRVKWENFLSTMGLLGRLIKRTFQLMGVILIILFLSSVQIGKKNDEPPMPPESYSIPNDVAETLSGPNNGLLTLKLDNIPIKVFLTVVCRYFTLQCLVDHSIRSFAVTVEYEDATLQEVIQELNELGSIKVVQEGNELIVKGIN